MNKHSKTEMDDNKPVNKNNNLRDFKLAYYDFPNLFAGYDYRKDQSGVRFKYKRIR